jgi:hypothetical protein
VSADLDGDGDTDILASDAFGPRLLRNEGGNRNRSPRVSLASPWKMFTGRYTRLGDVRELLLKTDDMFVVSKPGDELALSFDADALEPLPAGWTRTFLLYADGFSKEMDINSASPHEVAPMPFHGMKRYPYGAPESYPTDEAHRNYLERYNTRVVVSTLPQLWGAGR